MTWTLKHCGVFNCFQTEMILSRGVPFLPRVKHHVFNVVNYLKPGQTSGAALTQLTRCLSE
jgi:hypothetical protein